ncbi:hypothetical protein AB0E62_39635 [Streptomyces sp. NPDC038707]|uniref:hypothetical protein n=1 Tax=Streptomyces sp. NPDC038707 TaxID=3154329 RepID=UPI0033FE23FA
MGEPAATRKPNASGATRPPSTSAARPGWPLPASDGAYEPHEDAGHDLAGYLTGTPHTAAERLVDDAVRRAHALPDSYADNATALVTRITC